VASVTQPYQTFRVLLDGPSDDPRLGFDVYARAIADIIRHSRPQFAVGIFGDWGSGKTTLMRTIARELEPEAATIVPVWFNAWRYEREDHLIVPMLDVLREEVLAWNGRHGGANAVTEAASKFGRAARAILRGLTLKGAVPGFEASLDVGKVIGDGEDPVRPASFYHAAFADMRAATEQFSEGGARRIVVFVDDLDRCLPTNALQVLESMKLFFDFTGFVFVVGLDQRVIERSIEAKYQAGSPAAAPQVVVTAPGDSRASAVRQEQLEAPVSGAEYIKKLFQVPFTLPRVGTSQLPDLLMALRTGAQLATDQWNDLDQVVRPHLNYLSDRDFLNPREVKRLINAYTLQLKLLGPRLGPQLSAHTVLAIQLMGFRSDWSALYEVLVSDHQGFQLELQQVLRTPGAPAVIGDESEPIPQSFLSYMRGPGAELLGRGDLGAYVSSAEQTRGTESGSLVARQAIRDLRRILRAVTPERPIEDPGPALSAMGGLREALTASAPVGRGLVEDGRALIDRLEPEVKALTSLQADRPPPDVALDILGRLDQIVREIRRQTSTVVPA
jgi:KAP family P-loop domain